MSFYVLCPFCVKEKIFRRATPDLRDHVLQEHKRNLDRLGSLKNELFTEPNGFWFSLVPREYRQRIEPTDPKSACASAARDLVRNWLGRVRETSRSINDWERGWKLADEAKSKVTAKRNLESSLMMDIDDSSEHSEIAEPCAKSNKSDTYSPRRPGITREELVIHSICDTVDGIVVILYTEGQCQIWYRCILAKEITSDPRSYVSIVQKKAALKSNFEEPPTSMKEVGTNHLRMKESIANTLGIPSRLVTKLTYGIKLYQQIKNQTCKPYSSPMVTPPHGHQEDDDHPMPDSQFRSRSPTILGSNSHSLQPDTPEISPLKMSHGGEILLSDLGGEQPDINLKKYKGDNLLKPSSTIELSADTGPSEDPGYYNLGTEKNVSEIVVHSTNRQPRHSSGKYDCNDCEVIVLDTSHPTTESRKTAFDLLSTGVMPIIPPAKREWTNVCPLVLLTDPQPLYWPPKDWESLSPDARLFAWEMAAFRLHTSGRQPKPLDWDRVSVLTIYNMLALPGTAPLSVEDSRKEEMNMRQCNFNMMKKIVFHGTNSETDRMFLRMMEHASVHREKSTNWLTTLLDNQNIRLRLTK